MTILDDDQNKLSLWENDQGKIYLEVGPSDNEDAQFYTGFITLTEEDARALMNELHRLLEQMEPIGDEEKNSEIKTPQSTLRQGPVLPDNENGEIASASNHGGGIQASMPDKQSRKKLDAVGLTHKQSSAFQQIADMPDSENGRQLTLTPEVYPSKVKWNG